MGATFTVGLLLVFGLLEPVLGLLEFELEEVPGACWACWLRGWFGLK